MVVAVATLGSAVSHEEAGPSGAGPSEAANEADVVVEDAPSAPEHIYYTVLTSFVLGRRSRPGLLEPAT